MGCFCRHDVTALAALMAQLDAPPPPPPPSSAPVSLSLSLSVDTLLAATATRRITTLALRLSARGLPAPPWAPDPSWLDLVMPVLPMPAAAMATLVGLANVRAQARAAFGIDLLDPAAATSFTRLCATLSARIAAAAAAAAQASASAAAMTSALQSTGATLQALASLAFALAQVERALAAPVPVATLYAIDPMWSSFLQAIEALLPLIATLLQLGLNPAAPDLSATLAASLRALLAIRLPPLPMAAVQLSATLDAVATLRASFDIDPLAPGAIAAITEQLSVRVKALPMAALAALAQALAAVPPCPTLSVTAEVVAVAARLDPLAITALTWTPPPLASLPAISTGAVAAGLAAKLSTTLGIVAAAAPCASGCDGARLVRAIA